jgi:hypothetical protein
MALSPAKRAAARAEMQAQRSLPRYLTVYELAALMQRHEITVYEWARHEPERLPRVTRIADRVLFDARDVQAWFDTQRGDVIAAPTLACEPPKRGRGRPTKAEQVKRRMQLDRIVKLQAEGGAQ